MAMTPQTFDQTCMSLPGATMEVLWGADNVFKVGGKMFAVRGPTGTASFKVNDVAFEMLVETGAARPAPYMARAKWVFLDDLGSMPDADLRAYLAEAHRLIAAKLTRKARAAIGMA
jgi:predicted DNA-binding protein (MmcQ/YjbR family)